MHRAAILLALLCLPAGASAQLKEKFKPPEVKKIHIGFQTFLEEERTTYKVGLWVPIYVEIFGGTDGVKASKDRVPYVEVETNDSEDVGTKIHFPVDVDKDQTRTFVGYVKTGHMGQNFSEIKVTLVDAQQHKYTPRAQELTRSLDIDRHLYLVVGAKSLELNRAVKLMNKVPAEKEDFQNDPRFESGFRQLVYETNVERLPEMWFGYQGIDLMILATEDNRGFLTALKGSHERVKAIAQWVRRGGRLIVPISPTQQDVVAEILQSPAWQPPIPVTPPRAGEDLKLQTIAGGMTAWGGQALSGVAGPISIATLDPGRVAPGDWKVILNSSDVQEPKPIGAQVRYGLGQITYLALSLADKNFDRWPGKDQFLQTLIRETAPKTSAARGDNDRPWERTATPDVTTDLVRQLDAFDVTVIPFGIVALFIILYILIVGPLDFVLLKYVFKRLEWTWITFPTVVIGVSVIAYFAANALKGRDLKINKVDIVDFDLRTHLDKQTRQPASFHAYGSTFFTILSPRIQNYTFGVEPNPLFWGDEVKKIKQDNEVLSADLMSWLGRPSGGPHDMGRGGSGGFFRNAYDFEPDASALKGVPIPVWTTKSFTASWEHKLTKPPFVADLAYYLNPVRGKDIKIGGKIENHLAVDLTDVWLSYNRKFYRIEGGLKSVKHGGKAHEIEITERLAPDAKEWHNHADSRSNEPRAWATDPTVLVKKIMFTEILDPSQNARNHLLRPLDQSWRLQEEPSGRRTREAILFGRVQYVNGSASSLMSDTTSPLPTKLWINGDLPRTGKAYPAAPGHMNQDTYIRVYLAVRSGDE